MFEADAEVSRFFLLALQDCPEELEPLTPVEVEDAAEEEVEEVVSLFELASLDEEEEDEAVELVVPSTEIPSNGPVCASYEKNVFGKLLATEPLKHHPFPSSALQPSIM